ncbi:OmpW/AlkL family protein [Ferribacterium limneticum]|uniref:OmpW/AlkL family protein n=1 Tax=Ferribacterium limneticum TaxID=76259 RepID=UPI001CFC1CA7|nr:OmpW family outer membrane protein [Ferribacterium limneticum]UCV19605.1 OmpW family protein [Ferribacterium limneticum]
MAKKILVAALIAAGVLSSAVAQAQDGSFMVRVRAVDVLFDNGQKDGLNTVVGNIEADSRWIPELDLSYFFTKNIAAELVLTYPQTVDINAAALGHIGKIKALPPSLLVQYHFTDLGAFKPYVGLGVNYTIFMSRDNIALGASVEKSSVGLAGQVGFDYMFNKNWGLNVDVKYIQMETDVNIGATKLGTLNLSPITAGAGVSYRF